MDFQTNHFTIADHHLRICFHPSQKNSIRLIPSFKPFKSERIGEDDEPFLELKVDDGLTPVAEDKRQRIRSFDTGNGKPTKTSNTASARSTATTTCAVSD